MLSIIDNDTFLTITENGKRSFDVVFSFAIDFDQPNDVRILAYEMVEAYNEVFTDSAHTKIIDIFTND